MNALIRISRETIDNDSTGMLLLSIIFHLMGIISSLGLLSIRRGQDFTDYQDYPRYIQISSGDYGSV